MTHKEKIIATAYTGIMFVDGSHIHEVYKYEEEKLGHGVVDIMHASKEFQQKVRNAVKPDFLTMINKQEKINEEELENLAQKAESQQFQVVKQGLSLEQCVDVDFITGFKAGYRKAMEE